MPRLILYADDNPDDVEMFKAAVGESCPDCRVETAVDGQALLKKLDQLFNERRIRELAFIVLDVRMPGKDGIEVLYELKGNPVFRPIPVVMWSGVETERNMLRAYALGCNAYIEKPADYDALLDHVRSLIRFMMGTAKLPGIAKA